VDFVDFDFYPDPHLCSLERNVNGPFVSWTEHSLDHSYLELLVTLTKAMTALTRWRSQALDKLRNVLWNFRSLELSFLGTFDTCHIIL